MHLFSTLWNIRNLYGFLMFFGGVQIVYIGIERVKETFYLHWTYLSVHRLLMPVSSEIKGSKLKSSVNRLNLLKVLIVSSTSFFQGCAICSLDSSSLFSSSPSVITSVGCPQNSWKIYSTENFRDWLPPSRTYTSRNVERNGRFFVRSIFIKLFQCCILCF